MENTGGPLGNQTWHTRGWPQQKIQKFGFCIHTTAPCPMEQFFILFAKFDCPVAHQNFPLLATSHDCETGLWQDENVNIAILLNLCTRNNECDLAKFHVTNQQTVHNYHHGVMKHKTLHTSRPQLSTTFNLSPKLKKKNLRWLIVEITDGVVVVGGGI